MRALERPTADLTSYDLYLRALPLIRAWAREPIARAIVLLEQAVERDPKYGPAWRRWRFVIPRTS